MPASLVVESLADKHNDPVTIVSAGDTMPSPPSVGQVARSERKRLRGLDAASLPWISCTRVGLSTLESRWQAQLGAHAPRLICSSVETQLTPCARTSLRRLPRVAVYEALVQTLRALR